MKKAALRNVLVLKRNREYVHVPLYLFSKTIGGEYVLCMIIMISEKKLSTDKAEECNNTIKVRPLLIVKMVPYFK